MVKAKKEPRKEFDVVAQTLMIPVALLDENKGQIEGVPKNPRVIKGKRFKQLCESIKEDPELMNLRALLVYPVGERYVVVDGNMRLKALRDMAHVVAPCEVLKEGTTPEQMKRYIAKTNSCFGDWDWDTLANEWDGDPLDDWGIDLPEDWGEEEQEEEAREDDFDEAKDDVPTVCQRGDIWQLGDHRLMCGDSTDATDVTSLMDGAKAPLTFTDPPYRLATEGGGVFHSANSMKQIRLNGVDEFEPLKLKLYSETNIYTHNKPLIKEYILLAERENKPYDLAIYKKPGLPNYKGHLMTDIEYIAIIGEQNPKQGLAFEQYSKVFVGNKDKENDLSYSKPVALCAKFINLYSNKGDSVLDLFGGSGTTLIAAEQLHRKCYMMELDEHYCDVIIARWEKFTGEKAEKITNINQPK